MVSVRPKRKNTLQRQKQGWPQQKQATTLQGGRRGGSLNTQDLFDFYFQPSPVVSAAVASGCPVAAVNAAGSNIYKPEMDVDLTAWSQQPDICPYATFGMPNSSTVAHTSSFGAASSTGIEAELQKQAALAAQQPTHQVTLKLHPVDPFEALLQSRKVSVNQDAFRAMRSNMPTRTMDDQQLFTSFQQHHPVIIALSP